MSIQNGRLPIKITAAALISKDPIVVAGIILTAPIATVSEAVVQDGNNNDVGTFNTTATSGVSGVMFPFPIQMTGLSVPLLTGTNAILYVYLADE
jgi:hypothetical protein